MSGTNKILCCSLLLITLPAAIAGGHAIWNATSFFHAELIHQKQMAFGDKSLSMWARLESYAIWIPMAIFSIVAIWINMRLLGRLVLGKRGQSPKKAAATKRRDAPGTN